MPKLSQFQEVTTTSLTSVMPIVELGLINENKNLTLLGLQNLADIVPGVTGSRGETGYSGSFGVGYQGSLGHTGSRGYTGSTGQTGSIGFQGSAGVGFTGSIAGGFQGSQGITGFQGSASVGYTGSRSAGFQGSQGNAGFQGSIGGTGYGGSLGSQGYTGSIGSARSAGWTLISAWNSKDANTNEISTSTVGYNDLQITVNDLRWSTPISSPGNEAAWCQFSTDDGNTYFTNTSSYVSMSNDGVLDFAYTNRWGPGILISGVGYPITATVNIMGIDKPTPKYAQSTEYQTTQRFTGSFSTITNVRIVVFSAGSGASGMGDLRVTTSGFVTILAR